MRNIILIILSAFIFTACSTNESVDVNNTIDNKQVAKKIEVTATEDSDEFSDEFDDEFESVEVEVFDPLSGYNRMMTSFNDFFFLNVLNPVSKGYAYVTPEPVRVGVSNFFDNLLFPVRFTNNLLQLKFENSIDELGRFLLNSTFGLAGFLDPATTEFNMKQHDEDFGQTLGHYGVGEGFHIVLPLLGPSNLRDLVGGIADGYVSPVSMTGSSDIKYKIPNNSVQALGLTAVSTVNTTSLRLGQYENIKKDALDLYPFFRDIYNQTREKEIKE